MPGTGRAREPALSDARRAQYRTEDARRAGAPSTGPMATRRAFTRGGPKRAADAERAEWDAEAETTARAIIARLLRRRRR